MKKWSQGIGRTGPHSGFTLIELLVVIAIIGILSTVILAFLGSARDRGADAGIKRSLAQTRNQAELFFQANGTQFVITPGGTTDVCSPTALVTPSGSTISYAGIYNLVKSAADIASASVNTSRTTASGPANPAVCHACTATDASCNVGSRGNWGALVQLKSDTTRAFCVDSTGFVGTTTLTALASGDATCL